MDSKERNVVRVDLTHSYFIDRAEHFFKRIMQSVGNDPARAVTVMAILSGMVLEQTGAPEKNLDSYFTAITDQVFPDSELLH